MRVYLNGKEVARFPKFSPAEIEPFFKSIAAAEPSLPNAFTLGAKITAMALGVGVPVCSLKIGQHRVVVLGEALASLVPEDEIERRIASAEATATRMEAGHDFR